MEKVIKSKPVPYPGIALRKQIAVRGWTMEEAAERLGLKYSKMRTIAYGRERIQIPLALRLEAVLQIKAEFWLMAQIAYDCDQYRRNNENAEVK